MDLRLTFITLVFLACGPGEEETVRVHTAPATSAPLAIPETLATRTSQPDEIDRTRTPAQNQHVDELAALGEALSASRAEAARQLGTPLFVAVREERNPHGPWIDSLFTLRFRGAEVELLRAGYDGKEINQRVTLWGSDRRLPGDARIGRLLRTQAEQVFGRPSETRARADSVTLEYSIGEFVEEFVELRFVRDTLRSVEWTFYVD